LPIFGSGIGIVSGIISLLWSLKGVFGAFRQVV
jgi:hypothetical protein